MITDIDSPISFSPDQRQFAFMRGSPEKGITFLMIANADGSNVREFASLSAPDKFQNEGVSWSPDGKTILATATRRELNAGVFAVDTATAAATPIGGDWGFMRNVQWLPDGRSFLIDAIDLSGRGVNQQSPDGSTIYVTGRRSGTPHRFKVPAEGGDPVSMAMRFSAPSAFRRTAPGCSASRGTSRTGAPRSGCCRPVAVRCSCCPARRRPPASHPTGNR